MRRNKVKLFNSAIALLLCLSMLLGSTWAWFTDSVTSTANIISTGTLKVELYHTSAACTTPTPVTETTKDLFQVDLWEPGVAAYENFTVKSVGSLWLKYQLGLYPVDVNFVVDGGYRLSQALKAGVVPGGVLDSNADGTITREEAIGQVTEWKALELVLEEGALAPKGESAMVDGKDTNDTDDIGIVIWWEPTGSDNNWNVNNGKTTSDGNPLTIDLGVTLAATQFANEFDSFGPDYDGTAQFPELDLPVKVTVAVPSENGATTEAVTMVGRDVKATVPAGVKVADGTQALTLTVTEMEQSNANITTGDTEDTVSLDVHVEGVADTNTTPIIVELGPVMPKYLNMGNYRLYHVEGGVSNQMTLVGSLAELDAHNEFIYDLNTGSLTVAMATFSELTLVADTENAWEGKFDYSWYEGKTSPYTIVNADQLAGLSAIVGGMAEEINQDSFADKTVKLVADVNLGDKESENESNLIFYPIGYYNSEGTYEKTGVAITSGLKNFEGTFDGQGHTIKNFYHNTWEMKGDHDWYDPTQQYYRDGMGLFGKVYGGTVKNLTVDNFSSDGEIATTGVIAAYADGATFENIAITNCNPRVYNIGNGGIVGCVGWYAKEADLKTTFKNITVDNSNKISALWGSYDVACGGIVGQYYPTSGQTSAGTPKNAGIDLENCHVSAVMDVYNDVCGNYQYYAYRYAGMMIGSIRENTTNSDGKTIPNMTGISATGCTVNYGDWNDYYYCEFEKNGHPSYSGPDDYKFSRVPHSELNFTDSNSNGLVDADERASVIGCTHNHTDAENNKAIYLPFHQLFTGYGWGVNSIGLEKYSGIVTNLDITEGDQEESVEKFSVVNAGNENYVSGGIVTIDKLFAENENTLAIDADNVQVFVSPVGETSTASGTYVANTTDWTKGTLTFSGSGVATITITDYNFCTPTTFTVDIIEGPVDLFNIVFPNTDDYLYRVGNGNDVKLGSLFDGYIYENEITMDIKSIAGNATGAYTKNAADWSAGTIRFTGTGVVAVTIGSEIANNLILNLEVVDATNITSAKAGTGENFVLLNDVTYTGTYLYYKNSTLYGNGFTLDITEADHSDLKDASDTNSNKSAYCNIWMVDSRFDNVKIVGSVYPEVGMTADSNYGNAAIRTEGSCYITNSYVSNCRVPLRVQGNATLENTVVDGGRYANIELRSGNLVLDGVTTINTVRKGSDGTTDVIGFGIVIHSEAANAAVSVIDDGLKQYNWVGENEHKTVLSGDSNLSSAYKLIFNSNNSDTIYFDYNSDRYVNTGILCLCANINEDAVTGLDDRYCQEVSGYDAWVLTYDNSKHTEWFEESVGTESIECDSEQAAVLPTYSGTEAQTVEFTKGETYYFDTSVVNAEKFGQILKVKSVVLNGTTYNYGDKIPLTEGGAFEVVYTVVDPYNYTADGNSSETVYHTISVLVTAIAKDAEILAPKFTFIDQNGNKYESTTVKAGDKTYVMPNVTAADPTTNSMSSINIGSASISGTTVYFPVATGYTVRSGSNFNRYYPLFNGINITDYTIAGDTTGTTYTTDSDYTSLVGSSGTKFIIPANGGQTNCGDYVKTDGQAGNAAGNSDSGWQGAGYSTSYGGTYLKSGNTNASNGADSNGYERIVWVEYCFNAGNGDVYYYRIGYHCNKESAQSCVTPDTLVTLADGTQKRIDEVTYADQLMVWDFYKGEYTVMPSAIVFDHGYGNNTVIELNFSDGTTVKVVNLHQFFDADQNEFVTINTENVAELVGHRFVKRSGDGYAEVALVDYDVREEYVEAFGIISAGHYNIMVEDMFSTDFMPEDYGLFNYFAVGEDMKFDDGQMQADIEKYGLYTYEDFADYLTYEQFAAFNVPYFKIPVGKGEYTYEGILALIDEYLKAN